jgi:hypothetical protein
MAWEELLKTQGPREDGATAPAQTETRVRESLIRQAAAMAGQNVGEDPAPAENADDGETICRDGYVRRSPVQVYGTAADYNARRIRRLVTIVGGIVLVALVVLALVRSGLLRF